jgi:nitrogen-specific signal transduction histidine kinase
MSSGYTQKEKNPYTVLAGMQVNAAIMEINMEVPQNLKLELSYDPSLPLLGV